MFVIKTKDLGNENISAEYEGCGISKLSTYKDCPDHDSAAIYFVRNEVGTDLPKVGGVLTDVGIVWHVFDHEP